MTFTHQSTEILNQGWSSEISLGQSLGRNLGRGQRSSISFNVVSVSGDPLVLGCVSSSSRASPLSPLTWSWSDGGSCDWSGDGSEGLVGVGLGQSGDEGSWERSWWMVWLRPRLLLLPGGGVEDWLRSLRPRGHVNAGVLVSTVSPLRSFLLSDACENVSLWLVYQSIFQSTRQCFEYCCSLFYTFVQSPWFGPKVVDIWAQQPITLYPSLLCSWCNVLFHWNFFMAWSELLCLFPIYRARTVYKQEFFWAHTLNIQLGDREDQFARFAKSELD